MFVRVLSKAIARVRKAVDAGPAGSSVAAAWKTLLSEVSASSPSSRLSASSLPKFGHDCRSIPHCDAIGKLRCATALQPVVAPPLEAFAATGSGGGATHSRTPIPLSLDSSNGRKMHEEGLCKHGHIDHKKSVLVEP